MKIIIVQYIHGIYLWKKKIVIYRKEMDRNEQEFDFLKKKTFERVLPAMGFIHYGNLFIFVAFFLQINYIFFLSL